MDEDEAQLNTQPNSWQPDFDVDYGSPSSPELAPKQTATRTASASQGSIIEPDADLGLLLTNAPTAEPHTLVPMAQLPPQYHRPTMTGEDSPPPPPERVTFKRQWPQMLAAALPLLVLTILLFSFWPLWVVGWILYIIVIMYWRERQSSIAPLTFGGAMGEIVLGIFRAILLRRTS